MKRAAEVKIVSFMSKFELHLGQEVTYNGEKAMVDALLQNCVGLNVGGKVVLTSYDNIYAGI